MRRLLFIVIAAMGMFEGHSQALVQTYTDRCTGEVKVFSVQIGGQTVVAYYNKSRVFTSTEFTNGTLQAWLEETYSWYQALSPCSSGNANSQTTQQTTNQATSNATNAANNATSGATNNTNTGNGSTGNTGSTGGTGSSSGSSNSGSSGSNSSGNNSGGGDSSGNSGSGGSDDSGGSSSSGDDSGSSDSDSSSGNGDSSDGDSSGEEGSDTGGESEENKDDSKNEESKDEKSDEKSEEKDKEEEVEEEKKKEKEEEEEKEEEQTLAPPIVTANLVTMQMMDGVLQQAASFGYSQSSLTGVETYSANAMVWSNLKQFSLNLSQSTVYFNYDKEVDVMINNPFTGGQDKLGSYMDKGSIMMVQSISAGYMKMYSTHVVTAGISNVYLGQKENRWKGFVGGFALTSMGVFLDGGEKIATMSLTGFATKPFNVKNRVVISPMLAYSHSPMTYSVKAKSVTWTEYGTYIIGSNFDFKLSQRFNANIGGTVIGNTRPGIPLSYAITVGSRFQF